MEYITIWAVVMHLLFLSRSHKGEKIIDSNKNVILQMKVKK